MKICESCGGVVGRDCFNPGDCAWIAEQQEAQRDKSDWFAGQLASMGESAPLEEAVTHLASRVSLDGLIEMAKKAARYQFLRDKVAFTSWSGDVKIHNDLPMQLGDSLEDCQRRMDESIDDLISNG